MKKITEIEFLTIFSTKRIRRFAKSAGLIVTGVKLTPMKFFYLLTFGLCGLAKPSLAGLLQHVSNPISREGLHYRFTSKAVIFMQKCLVHLLTHQRSNKFIKNKILNNFQRILLVDSSSWEVAPVLSDILPGCGGSASPAGCKIQAMYSYKDGNLLFPAITSGNKNDQSFSKNIANFLKKRDLVIFDLGYFSFNKIIKQSAYFLTRFLSKTNIYMSQDAQSPINLLQYLSTINNNGSELTAFIGNPPYQRLKVRLLAVKVPELIGKKRMVKLQKNARKNEQTQLSALSIKLCYWTLAITNAPSSLLPFTAILPLYRIRWQIELFFKQLKSILHIHLCNSQNIDRLLCELYGKLIMAMFSHNIYSYFNSSLWNSSKKEISFDKVHKRCQEKFLPWLALLLQHPRKASSVICSHLNASISSCFKLYQKSRASSLQALDSIASSSPPTLSHRLST